MCVCVFDLMPFLYDCIQKSLVLLCKREGMACSAMNKTREQAAV